MGKRQRKREIAYGVAAFLLFAAMFLSTYRSRAYGQERKVFQIVTFGDSVFGEVRDETAIPAMLQELSGKSVFNAALGGTCAARREDTDRKMDYAKGSLSLAGLTKAILADDFGVQRALRVRENSTEYFSEVLENLETVDFTQAEIVLIQQGVNDYHAGTLIENPEDPYDEYSFLGALRSSVDALRKVNPELRIVLVTPTYTWYVATGLTCEEADYGGGILADYVEAELQIASELDIEVIDLYHDFFPHETWEDKDLYSRDGLHPNEAGREKLAQKIAEELGKER